MPDFGLNDRQKRFCLEYLVDLNATQAYMRSGYETSTEDIAASCAWELLRNPKVQSYVQKLMDERVARTGITVDRILKEYAAIAFSDITDAIEFNGNESSLKDSESLPKEVSCAIASVSTSVNTSKKGESRKVSIKMHDKLKALDMLARHTGISSDFNQCVAGLRRYGFNVGVDENGKPFLLEEREEIDHSSIAS